MGAGPDVDDPGVVVALTADRAEAALGDRLLAVATIGSLAHGGFCPQVSDVDVALVVADPGVGDEVAALVDGVRALGGLAARLSLFWSTPEGLATGDGTGRFPALDRLDLATHGRLLRGAFDPRTVAVPSLDLLVVEAVEFALVKLATDEVVSEIADPAAVVAGGVRHVTKRVLFPVRFLYTAATGRIGENDAAVDWYATTDLPSQDLVAAARRWRTEPLDAAAAVALLAGEPSGGPDARSGGGLLPLYRAFVDDHLPRVGALGRPDLVTGLTRWRESLG